MSFLSNIGRQIEGLSGLPVGRQISVVILLAATMALVAVTVLWSQAPNYQTLLAAGSQQETSRIVQALTRANIPYRIEQGSGAVQVPVDDLAQARMRLSTEGLGSGTSHGFEMMAEQSFGTSQFVEQARYYKAIEGELERSIGAMAGIAAARVHLAIPKQSGFARGRRTASASILVTPMPGRVLTEEVSVSIAQLVSASIPDLPADRVTVVDNLGRLLVGRSRPSDLQLTEAQLEYKGRYEEVLARRIESILAPIVGMDGVRAEVAADIDFTRAEETIESYAPDRQAVRSSQRDLRRQGGLESATGVPGALSNQPPGPSTAPEVIADAEQKAGIAKPVAGASPADASTLSDSSVVNYELDRTVSRVNRASGVVKRLSIAVLLDHVVGADPEAQAEGVKQALPEDDLQRIDRLVREAIGFDEKRGDTLSVSNIPFASPAEIELPEVPFWRESWVPRLARITVGGLVTLLLILVVLRPMGRALTNMPPAQRGLTAGSGSTQDYTKAVAGPIAVATLPNLQGRTDQMNFVRDLAREDPRKVSQVVKSWIGDEV